MSEKKDIRIYDKAGLIEVLKPSGEPAFRVKQLHNWIWKNGAHSFEEMQNLPKKMRAWLTEHFVINKISVDTFQESNDGTIKYRFRLHDGHLIEGVLIPTSKRLTACVSSQVGCSLTCKFCATGKMKRLRNLTAAEIYDQVYIINQFALEKYEKQLSNIVYMGMGEPLLNYAQVMESVDLISSEEGLGFSPRRITISTAGIAKMIRKMADDKSRCKLALSLHAATDTKRNEIMPINEQNNLEVLTEAMAYFYETTGTRLSFEYICFQRFNDSIEDAKALLKVCRRVPSKVNIIEYNPIDGESFVKSDADQIDKFADYLIKNGVPTSVRRSRGKDIDAACGQLANKG